MGEAVLITGSVAVALYLAILGAKFVICRRYAAAHPERETLEGEMTVMQPILGGDPFLAEALARNLDHRARFLWLVDEDDAEGLSVARAVANARVEIVLCPPAPPGANPKTFKLQRGLERIETEYFAVLDDDTMLSGDQLQRAMFALQTCTIYTGLPCYLRGSNFWSSLVTHFVNNNSITTYLTLLPLTGPLSINGMFYAMRTRDLRTMGGFAPIVSQLCDDYALASLIRRNGGTIRQGLAPQFLHTTVPDADRYVRLMHRWFVFANLLVRDQPARVKLLLVLFLGLPPILLWLGFLSPLALIAALLARHLMLRSLLDTPLIRPSATFSPQAGRRALETHSRRVPLSPILGAHSRRVPLSPLAGRGWREAPGEGPHFHWLMSILAELLQPLHWLHASLQHTLRWRTRRIALGPDGTFSHDPV